MKGTPTQCGVCGGEGELLLRRRPVVTSESKTLDVTSELRCCVQCGHLFTGVDIDWDDYYANQYDPKLTDEGMDELVSTTDGSIVFRTDLDYGLFRRHIGERVGLGDPIFEYGCGKGRILSRLKKEGFRNLWAHDLSERYRPELSALIGPSRACLGERPPPRPHRLVCSFFALEHDAHPSDAIGYLRQNLSSGGLLYLMVPNYRTNLADLACADHVNHFSGELLEAWVASMGFDVLVQDERSAIGATLLLAQRTGRVTPRMTDFDRLRTSALESVRPFLDALAQLDDLPSRVPANRAVYLYGAGFYAELAAGVLSSAGRKVAGIFDANPKKQGLMRMGKAIQPPESIAASEHSEAALVVCVNSAIAGQVEERFRSSFHDVVQLMR